MNNFSRILTSLSIVFLALTCAILMLQDQSLQDRSNIQQQEINKLQEKFAKQRCV